MNYAYWRRYILERVTIGDECWEWRLHRNACGYGVGTGQTGKATLAHRVAFEAFNECPIKPGLQVNHHCDNPACCRPSHLYEGTHRQNMDDMMRRDRHVPSKGECNGEAKLTEIQVWEIYGLYPTLTLEQIAERYGIGKSEVGNIINGVTWPQLFANWIAQGNPELRKHQVRLTPEIVWQIFGMRDQGMTQAAIAKVTGSSRQHISDILNGQKRPHLHAQWQAQKRPKAA